METYNIAIIGMGCVFPNAGNTAQLWQSIVKGNTCITPMPDRLWHMAHFYSKDRNAKDKSYCNVGAFCNDFQFPFREYKIPPGILKGIGSAQQVSLVAAKEALVDANMSPGCASLEKGITVVGCSGVDVFAHSTAYYRRLDYWQQLRENLRAKGVSKEVTDALLDEFSAELKEMGEFWNPATIAIGSSGSSISNRLAQVFGIGGFNTTVDAACSSTMVAIDTACLALMAKDARVAIAGGCDMGVNPAIYVGFSRIGGISASGRSNPFDESADGLVIGEGAGFFVLKRLEDALEDGDRIRAVIRGMGTTSDGGGQAIYNPSLDGRVSAFRKALKTAQVTPQDVQFVEAHATSTVVGDANEYDSIATVYGKERTDPLYLGSIKYQIGHLKAAAGAAGVMRAVLGMENQTIPHMPLFQKLTPHVRMKTDALHVPTQLQPWRVNAKGQRISAVTTSGFGGINYHCILENSDQWTSPNRAPLPSRKMAIVAAAVKVAGADSVEEFWENSTNERDVFQRVDRDDLGWTQATDDQPENERVTTRRIGRIKKFAFNPLKYKIFPKSVSQISPTQLVALDLVDQLLATKPAHLDQTRIGVSIGSMHDDYYPTIFLPLLLDEYAAAIRACPSVRSLSSDILESAIERTGRTLRQLSPPTTEHTLPGWMTNITPGRIANKFNLHGPNFIVDSACSSGVAAMLPAMYQLMFGEVDAMVTGGINIQSSEVFSSAVTQIGAVALDTPRPFDETGQGFLIGEGGVLYLVRRLEDARKNNESIMAIVHNVNGSSESGSNSMLAPTEEAIRRSMRQTLEKSEIDPMTIGVVDTHGSANYLSDIAEVGAIAKELRPDSGFPVAVTATKSHIGHLYGGSGASSILTVIQSLVTRIVPGICNLDTIRSELTDLLSKALPQKGTGPLHDDAFAAAVNSMGLGGSNYFAVLTAADWKESAVQSEKEFLPMSTESTATPSVDDSCVAKTTVLSPVDISPDFARYILSQEPALARVIQEARKRYNTRTRE